MAQKHSHDPRVNRVVLPGQETPYEEGELLQWQNYEVFQQQNRGDQHVHVGSIHAPNPDMALVLAKEQFGRREQCANLWVVKSQDVHATSYEDADMFLHSFDKNYREGSGYKVKDTIETFKRELYARLDGEKETSVTETVAEVSRESAATHTVINLPQLENKGKRKIIIRK